MHDCDNNEIESIISDFENGKSSDIPIRIIKQSSTIISPILSKYYNILMKAGIFPDVSKTGRITPIYKKDDAELLENYRPISTLPIFGKIFEKVIYSRLYNFLTSQNILYDKQFGFRKSHSTNHAINHSITHIKQEHERNKYVLGIFIDLSKAFDTIDHQQLIQKLSRYGIRGTPNKLIESYLSNRMQYTECLGEKSDLLYITFGVPQGSVLGPLLFLLYINDIINCSELGEFVLFADDTNIFVSSESLSDAFSKANKLLKSLSSYMTLNKLHINMKKCCYMIFKPPRKPIKDEDSVNAFELILNGQKIKHVTHAKFLGVTIDENLNWEQHIKDLKRKLYYAVSTLNHMRKYVPQKLIKDLYYTLFESHLSYCISAWGSTPSKLDPIHKIQKKAIRILFGDNESFKEKFRTCVRTRPVGEQILGSEFYEREHTKPLFKKHEILAVQNLYHYHTFMETFKLLKFRSPLSLLEHYQFSRRKCLTYINIIPPPPSDSYIYKSSVIWNTIRSRLSINDLSISTEVTKNQVRTALFANQHFHSLTDWIPTHDFNIVNITGKK